MNTTIRQDFISQSDQLEYMVSHFNTEGNWLVNGRRNKIKTFPLGKITVNVKSFKEPNFINKIAYRFFRSSKAQRSYEYAQKLLELGIGTPEPVAYFENSSYFSFRDSYYLSEQLDADCTLREIIENPNYHDSENILRQYTQFTFNLHENGVEFLDNTPGNTLIKQKENGTYSFYLVDLNRMNFHQEKLGFNIRMRNIAKLTSKEYILSVISHEYAKLCGLDYRQVYGQLKHDADYLSKRWRRKQALKKALGLKKK